jgi:hypothetical protein
MAWLTSLLKKPEAEQPVPEPELIPEEQPPTPEPTGPRLAVLVPDTAGISSFRLATMPDAFTAAEQIASLRADIRHETHAFWALHDKPIVDEGTHVEALVLIRAQPESDLVYVVSFLDIESAFSFTRFEVRRGLHLGNVMIYWAAFAQLREELDGISVTPEFAPPTENYIPPVPRVEDVRALDAAASVAVAEPAPLPEPEPEVVVEPQAEDDADTRRAVEEYLRRGEQPERVVVEPVPGPVAAEPAAIEEPMAEPLAEQPAPGPVAEFSLADDDEDLGPLWPEAKQQAPEPGPEAEISSPVAEEQQAIEEAFVFQHRTIERPATAPRQAQRPTSLEEAGAENGMLITDKPEPMAAFGSDPATIERLAAKYGITPEPSLAELAARIGEPEPVVETIPGDEELEFVPLNSADPASGLTAAPKLDDFDIAYEVERLLRGRKWEQRDGPFSGFQSPPGRF